MKSQRYLSLIFKESGLRSELTEEIKWDWVTVVNLFGFWPWGFEPLRTSAWGFGLRGWVREKKVWRDGERRGRFEEKSSPSGGCERQSASFLLQRHRSGNRGRVQVQSLSTQLEMTETHEPNHQQQGDTHQHHHQWWPLLSLSLPLLFSFLFLYLF